MTKHINTTGSCHCGNTTYSIDGEVTNIGYCDCPACQKATGSDKAAFVTVDASSLTFTSQQPTIFKNEGGVDCDAEGSWMYCPDCGSRILWKPDDGDQRDILAGTLADISIFTEN